MSTAVFDGRSLKELISAWLEATRGVKVPTGLEVEEALARARQLLPLVTAGALSGREVRVDDDFKSVLYGLVRLVTEPPLAGTAADTAAVHRFIRQVPWPDDLFGEKEELLNRCAAVGNQARSLSPDWAKQAAESLLAVPIIEREARARDLYADQPVVLYAVYELLRQQIDGAPARVRDDAQFFYDSLQRWPSRADRGEGFHEREQCLGEAALVAGTASRILARREEARAWFSRAESRFRAGIGLEADLCRLSYQRLALLTEERRFSDVANVLPGVIAECQRLGLRETALKCRFLEAAPFKESGRLRDAVRVFREIQREANGLRDERLAALALVNLAQLFGELGQPDDVLTTTQEAIPVLRRLGNRIDVAKALCSLGMLYRQQGKLSAAIDVFRSAQAEFRELGMLANTVAQHLVIAEMLFESGREDKALREIRAALPMINEHQLAPEGMALVSLLRQSLDSHRINRQALRDLSCHLDGKE